MLSSENNSNLLLDFLVFRFGALYKFCTYDAFENLAYDIPLVLIQVAIHILNHTKEVAVWILTFFNKL